eukprot:GDKH01026941.1.p2 GENE.GDKH01026941.1~~GDKH01026941.1.p2  ORF type:complete len:50 (+),score=18.48 GDKH01026941.1:2-151(+)
MGFGFPVTCKDGVYTVVEGLEVSQFSKDRIKVTLDELLAEQKDVASKLQ